MQGSGVSHECGGARGQFADTESRWRERLNRSVQRESGSRQLLGDLVRAMPHEIPWLIEFNQKYRPKGPGDSWRGYGR
jgi:hypothetical protein